MHCTNCGKKVDDKAEICVKCGVRVRQPQTTQPVKSKAVAVILAVLFSFWTWCYTYKRDYVKFWVGLGVSLLGIFLLFIPNVIVWIAAIIDAVSRDYNTIYKNEGK